MELTRLDSLGTYVQRSGRMGQRRVISNKDGAGVEGHAVSGPSPNSHRIRQRNGFLRPSSAGAMSAAHRRPANVRQLITSF